MSIIVKNLIDGSWEDAVSGRTFESINPADTPEVVGVVSRSDNKDVDKAVDAARRAFRGWRHTPAPKRGEIIFRAVRAPREAKERTGRADDTGDGESARRGAW